MPPPLPRWDRWRGVVLPVRIGFTTSNVSLRRRKDASAPTLPFSGPARRSLALRPACSPNHLPWSFHRRLRRLRCLHRRFNCYRLERPVAGRVSFPL